MKSAEKRLQFESVVREQHSRLRFFIRELGLRDAWVDDLAQETFLVAYRKWDELDDVANAGFWLRRIARNLVLNELTKSGRRQRLLDERITDYLVGLHGDSARPPTSEEVEETEIRMEALRECLSRLTDKTRRMIHARYHEEKSAADIGAEFDMNPSAVRKALFSARKLLGSCLGRDTGTSIIISP